MSDLTELLADVADSPTGPQVGAFFDFDGTLIDGYSAKEFFTERLKSRDIGVRELFATVVESANVERHGADITRLMNMAVEGLAGRTVQEINDAGRGLFDRRISGMIYPEARELIEAHVERGHTVVVASSATPPQIDATADYLGIPHVLATGLEADEDGVLTGRVAGPILWGVGKAAAVEAFAAANDIDLTASFAYSNGSEDVPFLEAVGRPRPLNPDDELIAIAQKRGWPVNRLAQPPHIGPVEVARSAASYVALGAGMAAGYAAALVLRNRRQGANVAAGVGTDLALAAGGITMNVQGAENLTAARPAVFLFNHQSQLDVLIVGGLVRTDFTGVAKIEASKDPMFGPIGYLMDVAYVDRGNTRQAKNALAPAVAALQDGRSIAIAPEGTRSATDAIGQFKKGAFHMAMQAGVPIVPIVIRNAGSLMRPHSFFMAPGVIDVKVLAPVDTSEWTPKTLDRQVIRVRQMYLDTMAEWAREGARPGR